MLLPWLCPAFHSSLLHATPTTTFRRSPAIASRNLIKRGSCVQSTRSGPSSRLICAWNIQYTQHSARLLATQISIRKASGLQDYPRIATCKSCSCRHLSILHPHWLSFFLYSPQIGSPPRPCAAALVSVLVPCSTTRALSFNKTASKLHTHNSWSWGRLRDRLHLPVPSACRETYDP